MFYLLIPARSFEVLISISKRPRVLLSVENKNLKYIKISTSSKEILARPKLEERGSHSRFVHATHPLPYDIPVTTSASAGLHA